MNDTDINALAIDSVAEKLGLEIHTLGAGLAELRRDQEVLPYKINLDQCSVVMEDGEEGSNIDFVMMVQDCNKREAKRWFKQTMSKKKTAPLSILEEEAQRIKPAQDFVDGIGYCTVALFVEQDGKKIEHPYIVTTEREVFPCTSEEFQERGLYSDKLSTPPMRWSQQSVLAYRDGAVVPTLQECYEYVLLEVTRYLDLGSEKLSKLVSLWIMGTYCYRLFGSYPYLHLNGNSGCGKTKTLTVIALLSFNGKQISSGTSPASILRSIDLNCCTCCIDEAEGISRAKDEESRTVLTLLNTGYKLGGGDEKCEQDPKTKRWHTVFFDGYSPKVLAGIRSLDATLTSRCIPIIMVRSQNREIKNREIDEREEDWAAIRSMLYPAMLQSFPRIAETANRMSHQKLSGREWELWKPIITLALLSDDTGALVQEMKELAVSIQNAKKETDTATPVILAALLQFLNEDGENEKFYPTEDLYPRLAEHDEDNFGWLEDITRKNARSKWIGHEMRKSGVVNGRAELRSIGGRKCRGYVLNKTCISTLLSAYDGYTVTEEEKPVSASQETG